MLWITQREYDALRTGNPICREFVEEERKVNPLFLTRLDRAGRFPQALGFTEVVIGPICLENSVSREHPSFLGFTPYLHYEDLAAAIEWLKRVFGFVEKGRWQDDEGNVTNAELLAGTVELWLDGTPGWWARKGRQSEEWIGVWVTDVDALHERVAECGIQVAPPQHKFYGVRVLQVTDPQGYTWGFMQRAPFLARSPR